MSLLGRIVPPLGAMERAWNGRYETRGRAADADCVVGFSFGYRGTPTHVQPGLSNLDLADVARKHYPDMPKILQIEIAEAYEAAGGKGADKVLRITKPRALKYTHLKAHQLDTLEVARQAQELMQQHDWSTALLLAHPRHLPRVEAVCSQLGIKWVSDLSERGAVEFDPRSGQRWTRSLGIWRAYEPAALMYYRLRGWL